MLQTGVKAVEQVEGGVRKVPVPCAQQQIMGIVIQKHPVKAIRGTGARAQEREPAGARAAS